MKRPFHDVPPSLSTRVPPAQRRVALVIGNGRYAHAMALTNPAKDAAAMADVLARLGFDVVKGIDVDRNSIGDVQGEFEDKLRTNPEAALLFYAGHGLQVDGKNYLIPIDVKITQKAHLATRALLFNHILEPMAQHAGASLIFLDACRDNPFARNLLQALNRGVPRTAIDALPSSGPIRGGLAPIEKVAGTFIAYATAPDTVAYDGKGENSPFTRALLRYIETPGLSIGDMMIDVRNSVLRETGDRQEPWDQSSLRSHFYFVTEAPEPAPASLLASASSAAAEELAAIQNTTSLALLARFKERYPDPPWSEYADIRMSELRAADEKRRIAGEVERANDEAEAVVAGGPVGEVVPQARIHPIESQTGAKRRFIWIAALFVLVSVAVLGMLSSLPIRLEAPFQTSRMPSGVPRSPAKPTTSTSAESSPKQTDQEPQSIDFDPNRVVCGQSGQKAIKDCNEMIRQKPADGDGYILRALTYEKMGDIGQAIADYSKAIELEPGMFGLYIGRAHLLEKLGQRQQAIADYRRALALSGADELWSSGADEAKGALKRLGASH